MKDDNIIQPPPVRFGLFVAVGTSGGGILRVLRSLLDDHADLERLAVLQIDSDGTMSFAHLPTPLNNGDQLTDWGPNTFVHIPPPDSDFVKTVHRGERPGFDHVPPAAFDAVNGDGVGVGGLVPLGNVAGVIHEPQIRGAVRRAINDITAHRSELNDQQDSALIVYEINGCMGGTWGATEPIHDTIRSETKRMGVDVRFERITLFPGQHPSKDMAGSMANAAAWLREYSARASGSYLYLSRERNGSEPMIKVAHAGPTWIVSDMNAAPGKSATLPTTDALFTQVGHWLRLNVATPLGARLEQALVDFRDDALQEDGRGERRVGRSFGISHITLNRERVEEFAANRLVRVALASLLASVDPGDVEKDVRSFNGANRLHEGAQYTHVSTDIRTRGADDQFGVDQVARFRNLLAENLAGLKGPDLLRAGPGIIDTTFAQTADALEQFRAARDAKIARTERAIEDRIGRWLWEPARGVAYVQAWLAEQKQVFERLVGLAAEDRRVHTDRIERMQSEVQLKENETIPQFLGMPAVSRWFNRRHVEQLADQYVRERRALEIARKEDQARAEAIVVLEALIRAFEERHAAITGLVDEVANVADLAAAEEERIEQWDGTFFNPNGFCLDDDLEHFYFRVIQRATEGEISEELIEQQAVLDLLVDLRGRGELLALSAEPGRLAQEVGEIARRHVRPRVQNLHVQDELFRRHPVGSKALAPFLRERDREAHERVTFNGNAQHDNPLHLLRFVVADGRRGTELATALNDAAYTRAQVHGNQGYELLAAPDSDRITMVQVRLSFPPSQVGLHAACQAAYDEDNRAIRFERNHTELVGRFLPRPGEAVTSDDARVALVKAYAMSDCPLRDNPAMLELVRGAETNELVLHRWQGSREHLGSDVADERHRARAYEVRVEAATRFYVTWRLRGPDALRQRVLDLAEAIKTAETGQSTEDALTAQVASMTSEHAVARVLQELEWYARNTAPRACAWASGAA